VAPGRFPGWRVVGAAFACLATTAGLGFYGLAVYLTVMSREQGWSVGSISGAVTVFFLVSGVAGLWTARLLDRLDVRAVVLCGAVVGAVALVLLGRVDEVWHVYVVYALLSLGHTLAGLVPATTVVTRWFHVRRSVALSVASTGLSVGGVLLTPWAKWLLDRDGLEAATPWLAVAWVLGIVPLTIAFLRSDPAALGWQPDGVPMGQPTATVVVSVPYREAVRSRFFLAVTAAFTVVLAAQVGGIQQLVKLVEERVDTSTATLATSLLAGSSIVARLVGGRAAAKASMSRLAVGFAATQGIALLLIASIDRRVALLAAIVLFGATVGNLLMLHPLLVGHQFGPADYARIFSRSQLVAFLGTAAGPLLLGALHDATGGYLVAYLVAGCLSLTGAVILVQAARVER
jgi:MFS family permease